MVNEPNQPSLSGTNDQSIPQPSPLPMVPEPPMVLPPEPPPEETPTPVEASMPEGLAAVQPPSETIVVTQQEVPPPKSETETPKKSRGKLMAAAVVLFLVLASIPAGVFLVKQRQEIREKAVGEGQLVCMPIDDAGNLTNEKYQYNRIKVINNTTQQVALWIQKNLCPYQGTLPSPGYRCDQYLERSNDSLAPGQEKIYSLDVPACQIGQLDVARDGQATGVYIPDCYNTVDQRIWEGGIAFTIKANSDCTTPQCLATKAYDASWNPIADPNTIKAGQSVRFTVLGQPAAEFTKARFRINQGSWQETTTQKPGSNEFYIEYTIPLSGGSFTVEGEVYNPTLGWK